MNTSSAIDSANPLMLALGYYWKGRRSLGRSSDDDERYVSDYSLPVPPRRRSRPPQGSRRTRGGSIFIWLLLILLILAFLAGAIFVTWAQSYMQDYVPMDSGDTPVAQIHSTQQKDHMKIHLILFDNRGHEYTDEICDDCVKLGNTVLLKGDMIRYPDWLSHFLTSGYKLTTLRAYYNNSARAKNRASENVALNGGDDTLFQNMQKWGSIIGVAATVSNSVVVPADGRTYNVLVSPTKGLHIEPVNTTSARAGED